MARLRILAIAESAAGATVLGAGLARCNRLHVLAVTGTDSGALARYWSERPDVAVVELGLEGAGGLGCIAELTALALPVVAVLPDLGRSTEAWDAGARGLVLAGAADAWQPVIEVVAGGGIAMAPDNVATIFFEDSRALALIRTLTPREVEVLIRVAEGEANSEIARALGITRSGVDYHMRMIYEKLGVHNRAAAASFAMRLGLRSPRRGLGG